MAVYDEFAVAERRFHVSDILSTFSNVYICGVCFPTLWHSVLCGALSWLGEDCM